MSESKGVNKPKLAWYENNKDFTDPIVFFLKDGFDVKVFGVPEESERKIIEFDPNMIIFDYRMPRISGLAMFENLKKKKLRFIPVFYTIWANDDDTLQKLKHAGIEDNNVIDKHMGSESFAKKISIIYSKAVNNDSN